MKQILSLIFIGISFLSIGQVTYKGIGSGFRYKSSDNSFYMKATTRIQPQWDFKYNYIDSSFSNKAVIGRARLKFDGYLINENLRYKIEYDLVNGYVRDAVIKYRMGNFDLWFGQTKLPGNHERLVSSANLQLVNRSLFNSHFTLDRDIGFQLHHSFSIKNVVIRDKYAFTAGNGILDNQWNEGFSYTAKLEVLPFGVFTKKGEFITADIYKEQTPKLIATAYINYNTDAYKSKGQTGINLNNQSDLLLFGFDILFKYKGFSALIESGKRQVSKGSTVVLDNSENFVGAYYVGWGLNAQSGYVFDNMWGMVVRYSTVDPQIVELGNSIRDYTVGINKYIIGNKLKIQADLTYRENTVYNEVIGRLLMELQF